jgi:hypothetical protein
MAASAIHLVDVEVAHDGLAAPDLSRCHPYGPTSLHHKMQGMDGVALRGHPRRVHAATAGVRVTAFAAATARAASRAGIRQILSRPVGFGRLIPLIDGVAGTP